MYTQYLYQIEYQEGTNKGFDNNWAVDDNHAIELFYKNYSKNKTVINIKRLDVSPEKYPDTTGE